MVRRSGSCSRRRPTAAIWLGTPFIEMRGTEKDLGAMIGVADGAVKYAHMIEAATWGLNRIGADQRGRSGCSVTVVRLGTGVRRASPDLDMTVGDPRECGSRKDCVGRHTRKPTCWLTFAI